MKKLTVFALLLILIANYSYSQSGWFWLNPLPQGNTLNDIDFVGNGIAYACGEAGTIMKTLDNGNNWVILRNDSGYTNNSLDFFNINTGWVIGKNVMKTTDGGYSWINEMPMGNSSSHSIEMISIDTGYFTVGNNGGGYVYKTTNSGLNWVSIFYQANKTINNTFFINGLTGFACGSMGINKTTNGGANWQNQYQFSGFGGNINALTFLNSNTGIAVGKRNTVTSTYQIILKTTNNGNNWNEITGIGSSTLFDIKVSNNNTLFACGSGLLKSTNAGNNWISIPLSDPWGFYSIDFSSSQGMTVGFSGIIFNTTNYGDNWINNFDSHSLRISATSIQFYNKNIGYATIGAYVLKTTNSGANWISFNTSSPTDLLCLSVVDSSIVFAGGGNTTKNCPVVKTTNGGISWSLQNPYVGNGYLYSIFFIDLNTGFCSASNVVSKTTNGGTNWIPVNINNAGNLSSLFFVNYNTGYVFGNHSYKTTDSGLSWNPLQIFGNTCYFLNPTTGFVAGMGMRISKTTNGGLTWIIQTQSSESWSFLSIHFINSNYGVAVGSNGAIASTTNGGNNWFYQKSPTNSTLESVFLTDTNEGFIAGPYGLILKTTTGGNIIGINNISQTTPNNFILSQNYPNPFNPQTKIKFDVPVNVRGQTPNVKLVIYDLLGREVATLVNGELKPGTYEADWDASNFSSGVYFYKIILGDPSTGTGQVYTETKKMVLMK